MIDISYEKQGSYLQGKREGISETKLEDILGMYKEGLSAETIARIVKYPVDKVCSIINAAVSSEK